MELTDQIYYLSLMKVGHVFPIHQGDDTVYLCRTKEGYAVALPFADERMFNESFVGVSLMTNNLTIGDKTLKALFLFMAENGDLKKFAYIATEFADIQNRKSILEDPYDWVDDWKELFGNSVKKYMVTDVVAELFALKHVFSKDKSAKWMGPKDGTHDIVMDGGVVEVKSTINKTNTHVSINSAFQINPDVNESLYFVRLEPKPYSNSIDSLVNELVGLGYSRDELEDNLSIMGYREGNRTRKQSYAVLSMTSYAVNEDNFPIIGLDSLNDLTKTKNIIAFKLTLDLATITGETIC